MIVANPPQPGNAAAVLRLVNQTRRQMRCVEARCSRLLAGIAAAQAEGREGLWRRARGW